MTEVLWREWLQKINKKFEEQNWQILLFVDNFSGHKSEITKSLSNVRVVFLSANCTSKLQSLDHEIVSVFKRGYKSSMVDRLIQSIDENFEVKPIDM